ncbi:alpha/beta hydrolase [Vibrio sp. B172a]|uniref:gamma-mobile-trio protein GmtX n=1 Tax=Vibrio sp. B172a TaxID=2835790 RepID=UPI00255271FF|nr:gamma-mobile-trio protein GmtX [Vibrio sp. B172a]MDK9782359.1 alpha/beta hydrolase [Vibrio sp. B172a]
MTEIIHPDIVLEELCSQATTRTESALRTLNAVLAKQSQIEPLDFSIATIGKLSKAQGGPTTQTIRNRTGKHFQQLIDAWAAYSGTTRKKPLSVRQKQLLNSNDQHILDSIDDPVIRAVVGSLIAERNKYRDQLNVLKANSDIVIDRTLQKNQSNAHLNDERQRPDSAMTPLEAEAIRDAISDEKMQKMEWVVMPTGQVKDKDGHEIYRRGYVHVLSKLLEK